MFSPEPPSTASVERAPGAAGVERVPPWLLWLAFLAVAVALYFPSLRGGLLWDDQAHLLPPSQLTIRGLRDIWLSLGAQQQYYPVLYSAFWLEGRLWGDTTLGYHLVNVVWHVSTAVVLVLILRRLGLRGGLLAGLLFLVHPVCVESVAWMSEQKNTLAGLFASSAVLVYLGFHGSRRRGAHGLATALFALALMTKSVTAPVPGVLLCILWWRQGRLRWREDVLPTLPWFAMGAAFGLLTAWNERTHVGASGDEFGLTLVQRTFLAGRVVVFYLSKLAWPSDLLFTYPRWTIDLHDWKNVVPLPALAAVSAVCIARFRTHRGPAALLAIYVGTLFPVLGFLNVYPFVFSYVADHFQYFAAAAAFCGLAAWWTARANRWFASRNRLGTAIPAAVLITLAVLTQRQARTYASAETLYRTTLARNPDSWMAHNNLGVILGREPAAHDEAVSHIRAAVRLRPSGPDLRFNLGNALAKRPETAAEAEQEFREALRLAPGFADAHNNLGKLLVSLRRPDEAVNEFRAAASSKPDFAEAHANLALALSVDPTRAGEALAEFGAALSLDPALIPALLGRGALEARLPGKTDEAIADYSAALRIDPAQAEAHFQLGRLLAAAGDRSGALRQYEEALRLEPDRQAVRALIDALRRDRRP